MAAQPEPVRGPASPYHNWPLMRRIVELLRKSSVGLAPSTLLEILEEEGRYPKDEVSRRGTYQRVLRALQQLESMRLVVRSGRRYILQPEALQEELQRQAGQAVQRLLEVPFLSSEPEEIQRVVAAALAERMRESTGGESQIG